MNTLPAPGLIERAPVLAALCAQVADLARGHGGCALVEGDAGLGKTSLLRALREATGCGADWMVGSCEPLLAPPPLAPFLDMLSALPPRLAEAVRSARTGPALFADLLSLLRDAPRPLVLAVEDVQWADGATLDLLRFLARRIAGTRALLLLTWRDAEVGPGHPWRMVLAGMDPTTTQRHALAPLSPSAVTAWARQAGRDWPGLHAATGGNPFYVSQLLSMPAGEQAQVPAQVRDALLARVSRLSPPVRELLEMASLSPVPLELAVIQHALAPEPAHVQGALASGLLCSEGEHLRVAHDLARVTIAGSLGAQAAAMHAALFDALSECDAPLARQVHHADLAGLAHAVIRLAPIAARQAAAAHAHRQAAALFALALRHAGGLDARDQAELSEAHADECLLLNQFDAAMDSRQRAMVLAADAGDTRAQGRQLRVMARIEWMRGRPIDGEGLARAAIDLLQRHEAQGRELAMAWLTMGQLRLLADDPMQACEWVDRALPRLRSFGDQEAVAYALNTSGAARLGSADEEEGLRQIERARALALDLGDDELAARAWTNLAAAALVQHRLADLERLSDDAIAYCEARDLDLFGIHLKIRRACGWLAAGRWGDAATEFGLLAQHPAVSQVQGGQLAWLRAFVAVRRGAPGADAAWIRLADDGPPLIPVPWYFDATLMRLEAAWLRGALATARTLAEAAWAVTAPRRAGWRRAELAVWRQRLGLPVGGLIDAPPPLAQALASAHEAAAAAWADLGMPYEQALSLADGDELQQRRALSLLLGLGANAAAACVRRSLRRSGASGLPRGPYNTARQDRLGLTAREREVLDGLRDGLSNREIALRLHRSERTVEGHVAALIGKLGARDRHDAARRAMQNPGSDH